jgi:DNA-directed RNA polymerase subunit H (RpoH/RPB5)
MGLLERFKRKNDEDASEIQNEEVVDTDSAEISSEMEQEHEKEDLVEEKETETLISDTNADDLQEVNEEETISVDATEVIAQEEETEVSEAEKVAEEVQVPKIDKKDVVDVAVAVMEDDPENKNERVDPFFDPSKKYYSDVKLSILENRLETLLEKEKQLLNHPNPDTKKLEELAIDIQHIRCEIDDAKYEACRFSSDAQ